MSEQQDAVARLRRSLKVGQGLLGVLAQHAADVAVLTREVAKRREEVEEWTARLHFHVNALEARLRQFIGAETDKMGFGRRMR